MHYLKVIGLSGFSLIFFTMINENYFCFLKTKCVSPRKTREYTYNYYQINFDGDTIENKKDESYKVFFKYSNGNFYTDSILDGKETIRFSGFNRKNESLNFKLNNFQDIKITYSINYQNNFPINSDSNLIIPQNSIYKGSFYIRDKKLHKFKVHKFLNFEKFEYNYYHKRSYSFVLENYLPLYIYYPDANFSIEIESKDLIADLIKKLKKSKEFVQTTKRGILLPK